ncbi:MAG TPA: hypothetical protein VFI66_06320 [Gemmatimonadales bacterium]|nr:hypothetical protein [Gemmatimonadales bacterium]
MKIRGLVLALVAGTGMLPRSLTAQDVTARLGSRVTPEVRQAVQEIAGTAAARGLPVEPLIDKAIEGGAKGVPADRVIAAVRAVAARLGEAADALRGTGTAAPDADVVEGGADALNAGLSAGEVRDLALASRPPYDPALTLRVAATLAALGVPPKETVTLVLGMIRAGRSPAELLGLPGQVQAGVAGGATPAQAAAGLARAAGGAAPGRAPGWVPPGQTNPHRPPAPHKP